MGKLGPHYFAAGAHGNYLFRGNLPVINHRFRCHAQRDPMLVN